MTQDAHEQIAPMKFTEHDVPRSFVTSPEDLHPAKQQIEARQSNRNLLLSATAEIDTRPELEIYANDVKCSHGATTGQLDPAALFYLRSRGLSLEAARSALIQAFAGSILTGIASASVRSHIEQALHGRFETGASS